MKAASSREGAARHSSIVYDAASRREAESLALALQPHTLGIELLREELRWVEEDSVAVRDELSTALMDALDRATEAERSYRVFAAGREAHTNGGANRHRVNADGTPMWGTDEV